MTNAIEFDNVSKRFHLRQNRDQSLVEKVGSMFRRDDDHDVFWALRNVSFTVPEGQSIGLVGHNGAGKSTALKLMTRILEPSSGNVTMRGRVAALLELGSGFHPELSGRENVFLYGSLMGLSAQDMRDRLDEITEFADIGRFFDTEIKHYSSGMYTRLAFAVATAVDPDVLITDEILAVGDEDFQRKCMERIFHFRNEGKTIVFVSHALEFVRLLCDQAVWLEGGRSLAVGTANEVIDAYLEQVNRRERERLEKQGVFEVKESSTEEEEYPPDRRYGSREVEIVRVDLLDKEGHRRPTFETGEPLVIRIYYHAKEPIGYPVFGIGIHHEGGFWLTGPNTHFADLKMPRIEGPGYVEYTVPALPLLAGRYLISTVVYDGTMMHPYDHHDRLYRLIVQTRKLRERHGVLALDAEWSWREGESGIVALNHVGREETQSSSKDATKSSS